MFWRIFFIFLQGVFNIEASSSYCVSETATTWNNASKTQVVATPDLIYNEQNLSANIDIQLENEVWIGYFKALIAFEYFGCMRIGSDNNSFKLKSNAPGHCFSACGKHDLVGLCGDVCYCLENDSTMEHHLPYCDQVCEGDDAFLCGGAEHISLYKINMKATSIIYDIGKNNKCLQLERSSWSYTKTWKPCKTFYQMMCTFGNGTILTNGQNFQWENATKKCFKLNAYATRYTTLDTDNIPKGSFWTGVVRSSVIYKYGEADGESYGNIECGYTNNAKQVLFTDRCGSILKKFLCHNEITAPMTTPTTLTTTSKLVSRIDTTKTEVTLSSEIHSTSLTEIVTSSIDISAEAESAEESRDSEVGAVIGASIVSVLVVTAVVVVIVILKRRKKLPSLCKEAIPAKEFGYQQPTRTIDELSRENHDYDHANVHNNNTVNINSDSNYAHTYFVLEPHVNESNTDNATYDTSGNANKTITEQDNVYNRLETDNNQTYDHAHTKIRNGVLKFDDTYDTTDKAAMKLKTRTGKDSDVFGETDEDAYNHITSKPVSNTKTENEYGVPNAYGDVKNNTQDEGDTYSHINNKPQNKGNQGNQFRASKQMHGLKLADGGQDADYDETERDEKLLTADNDYSIIGTIY